MKSKTSLGLSLAGAGAAVLLGHRLLSRTYSFSGNVVAITGGSRGLGLALARQLAREGASLALLARDRAELERARMDLARHGAPEVQVIACDIRNEAQVREAMQSVHDRFGWLDMLINNAGMITVGPLETMTREDWEDAMDLHFWAPFNAIDAALPMLRQGCGKRIVNIASFGGKVPVPHMAPYCASKAALIGLSTALRTELAPEGIMVTTVSPGLMRTGSHVNAMFKGAYEQEFAWFAQGMAAPGASMAADRAARQILNAARKGRPEIVLSMQANAAVLAQAVFPNLAARIAAGVNRMLPGNPGGPASRRRWMGWQARGKVEVPFINRADQATHDLNGMRGREDRF